MKEQLNKIAILKLSNPKLFSIFFKVPQWIALKPPAD
jgi:hypothetical protein